MSGQSVYLSLMSVTCSCNQLELDANMTLLNAWFSMLYVMNMCEMKANAVPTNRRPLTYTKYNQMRSTSNAVNIKCKGLFKLYYDEMESTLTEVVYITLIVIRDYKMTTLKQLTICDNWMNEWMNVGGLVKADHFDSVIMQLLISISLHSLML